MNRIWEVRFEMEDLHDEVGWETYTDCGFQNAAQQLVEKYGDVATDIHGYGGFGVIVKSKTEDFHFDEIAYVVVDALPVIKYTISGIAQFGESENLQALYG